MQTSLPWQLPPSLERWCGRVIIISIFFNILLSQWECFPMGNSGRFPQGKPAATEPRYPTLINHEVHAGSFFVSGIHQSLTWTTGSLMCVREHSCACVYIHTRIRFRLGTSTASQHNLFHSEKLTIFCCAPGGIRTFVLWILSLTLYQLTHPVTLI